MSYGRAVCLQVGACWKWCGHGVFSVSCNVEVVARYSRCSPCCQLRMWPWLLRRTVWSTICGLTGPVLGCCVWFGVVFGSRMLSLAYVRCVISAGWAEASMVMHRGLCRSHSSWRVWSCCRYVSLMSRSCGRALLPILWRHVSGVVLRYTMVVCVGWGRQPSARSHAVRYASCALSLCAKVAAANTWRLLRSDLSIMSVVCGSAMARLVRMACTRLCSTTNWKSVASSSPLCTCPSRCIHLSTGSCTIVYLLRGQWSVRWAMRVDFPAPMLPSMRMR